MCLSIGSYDFATWLGISKLPDRFNSFIDFIVWH